MKTLSAIKFRLSELYMPTVVYVLLLFMASLAALIAGAIDKSGNVAEMNVDQVYAFSYYGTGFVAFLLGIISYKTHFKFLLQNGVSRQHIHLSFICSLVYAVLLYIENAGFHFLFSYVAHLTAKTDAPFNVNIPSEVLILVYATLMCVGYLASCFIYSTKPLTKIITASAAVLAVLIFILRMVQLDGQAEIAIVAVYCFIFGSVSGYIYTWHVAAAMLTVILFCLSVSHMITLKATVKK